MISGLKDSSGLMNPLMANKRYCEFWVSMKKMERMKWIENSPFLLLAIFLRQLNKSEQEDKVGSINCIARIANALKS